MAAKKHILMIAGPNGAGKTTFAREYLPREGAILNFINADLIAAGLSPFKPEAAAVAAGRLMLREIAHYVDAGESFSFETTLSSRRYSRLIPQWKSKGYRVELAYMKLASVEMAIVRVKNRIVQGGHAVPEVDIRRRFARSLINFEIYKPLVDEWRLFDNSGSRTILIDGKV